MTQIGKETRQRNLISHRWIKMPSSERKKNAIYLDFVCCFFYFVAKFNHTKIWWKSFECVGIRSNYFCSLLFHWIVIEWSVQPFDAKLLSWHKKREKILFYLDKKMIAFLDKKKPRNYFSFYFEKIQFLVSFVEWKKVNRDLILLLFLHPFSYNPV